MKAENKSLRKENYELALRVARAETWEKAAKICEEIHQTRTALPTECAHFIRAAALEDAK